MALVNPNPDGPLLNPESKTGSSGSGSSEAGSSEAGSSEAGWVIERYLNNRLHYWSADKFFTENVNEAIRFSREQDAATILVRLLDGVGRVTEHMWYA